MKYFKAEPVQRFTLYDLRKNAENSIKLSSLILYGVSGVRIIAAYKQKHCRYQQ